MFFSLKIFLTFFYYFFFYIFIFFNNWTFHHYMLWKILFKNFLKLNNKHFKILAILSNTNILWIMQIIIKLKCNIFMSSNKYFIIFFTYQKMSKNSSGKYYQENKGRLQKKAHERFQSLSIEEKEKSNNMVVSNAKFYQMKSKSLLIIKKI